MTIGHGQHGALARRIATAMLLMVSLFSSAVIGAEPDTFTDEKALLNALRGGGLNIYFRHVSTEWSQTDDLQKQGDWLSCVPSKMRQLSAVGRSDAVTIGDAMRRLEIPVAEVVASPYCRTMETARLMNLGSIEASTDVMNLRAHEFFGGRAVIVDTARRLLSTATQSGANRVIVAHGNVALVAAKVYPEEGEGLVFKPEGEAGFSLVGRIELGQWARLLAVAND